MKAPSRRTIAATAGTAMVLGGVLLAGTGPAEAASASQAASICGPGYYPLDEVPLDASTLYLSYNGSTDCAVNIKTQFVGTPTSLYVYVQSPNGSWGGNADDGTEDAGSYSYYAGPVYTYAPHDCIDWGGGDGYISRDYEQVHCG